MADFRLTEWGSDSVLVFDVECLAINGRIADEL